LRPQRVGGNLNEASEFIAVVQKDGNDGFVCTFPAFSNCISFASAEEEAIVLTPVPLAEQIEEIHQSSESIPELLTFTEVFADTERAGALIMRIHPKFVQALDRQRLSHNSSNRRAHNLLPSKVNAK
jgi:predicted RNase H-like HicB family nuclease